MGELIVLPRAERPVQTFSSREGTAEILFFTGVRYYRMTDEDVLQAVSRDTKVGTKPRRRHRSSAATIHGEMRIDVHA